MDTPEVILRAAQQKIAEGHRVDKATGDFMKSTGIVVGAQDGLVQQSKDLLKSMNDLMKAFMETSKISREGNRNMSGFVGALSTGGNLLNTLKSGASGNVYGVAGGVMGGYDQFRGFINSFKDPKDLNKEGMFAGLGRSAGIGLGRMFGGDSVKGNILGNQLGAEESYGNIGAKIGGMIPGVAGAVVGLALAGLTMGATNVMQNWGEGYRQTRRLGQLANYGVGGGGLRGGLAAQAAGLQMQPEEYAGVGMSYVMAGGRGGNVQELMRTASLAQKNWGASAEGLSRSVGDITSWGKPDNLNKIFTDAGRYAFGAGVSGQFSNGMWTGALGGMTRALTVGGGMMGRITTEDTTMMNKFLSRGVQYGYRAPEVAQVWGSIAQALPQAAQDPASHAFLAYRMGLSTREMYFPDTKTFSKMYDQITQKGGMPGIGSPEEAKIIFGKMFGGQAGDLVAKMMFAGKEGKPMSEREFQAAMEEAMKGDIEKTKEIADHTNVIATALNSGNVKSLLESMSSSLTIMTMKAASDLVGGKGIMGQAELYGQMGVSEEETVRRISVGNGIPKGKEREVRNRWKAGALKIVGKPQFLDALHDVVNTEAFKKRNVLGNQRGSEGAYLSAEERLLQEASMAWGDYQDDQKKADAAASKNANKKSGGTTWNESENTAGGMVDYIPDTSKELSGAIKASPSVNITHISSEKGTSSTTSIPMGAYVTMGQGTAWLVSPSQNLNF